MALTTASTTTTFSLHPGTVSTEPFDWTKSNDLKVHKMAVEKLVHEFDLSPGDFRNFMTEVETRSDAVGFNNLYSINVTRTNAAGSTTTVQKEYGQIRIDDVCNCAAITLNTDGHKAQLEAMLYTCLNQSLSKGAQKRMALKRQYFETAGRKSGTTMRKVQTMAKWGLLPRRLEKCPIPVCTSCMFGKAIRQPWRTKPTKAHKPHTATAPGQCVSVDQLESTTPGLIAQLRGRPTIARYTVATVFVDQFSGLSYVHLQKGTGAIETLSAKTTFEAYSRKHGVRILHYHADNGIFADNLFTRAVDQAGQNITYCGVNAHWQNGRAERRIRLLRP